MSQRDLCERFGVPRSTMSDWLGEWERSGLIPNRRTVGRCKALVTS
jgi:transposase